MDLAAARRYIPHVCDFVGSRVSPSRIRSDRRYLAVAIPHSKYISRIEHTVQCQYSMPCPKLGVRVCKSNSGYCLRIITLSPVTRARYRRLRGTGQQIPACRTYKNLQFLHASSLDNVFRECSTQNAFHIGNRQFPLQSSLVSEKKQGLATR